MKKILILSLAIIILQLNLISDDTVITDSLSLQTKKTNLFDFSVFRRNRTISPSIRLSGGVISTDLPKINKDYFNWGIELGTSLDVTKVFWKENIYKKLSIPMLSIRDTTIFTDEEINKLNKILNEYTFYGINLNLISSKANDLYEVPFNAKNPTPVVDMLNFGFSDIEGMGYTFSKNMGVRFLTGDNMQWTYFDKKEQNDVNYEIMNMYDLWNSVRFGKRYQSEVNVKLFSLLSIYANIDRLVIFPRYIFWQHFGSAIVESIGTRLVNSFTNNIKYLSPYLYPVAMFILNTAYNYGWTELLRKDMNWPFNNDYPTLVYDKLKVGIQIDF